MRIAYLIGRYPTVSHTFVLREVRELRRLGWAIDTFSIWRSSPDVLLSPADWEEFESTHALLPPRPLELLAAHARALTRPASCARTLLRALRLGGPGLRGRLMGLTWYVESMALWRQCRRRGIRHVHVHIGGTASAVALLTAGFANGWKGGEWSWSMTVHGPNDFYERQLAEKVREADFVVCISDFARSQLMMLVEETHWSKLHVVHCGVDVDAFPPRARAEHRDESRPPRLLTVGRLDRIKGQGVVLQALAELAAAGMEAELVVVGDGPRRAALEDWSRRLGLEGRVRWCGAIGQDAIRDYYAEADVFCMSSFAEGVPVVLMEAMATELPVVATRITGIPELVDHGVNGLLVRPGRPDQLAAALDQLIADADLARRMGRAGREKVIAEYDIRTSGRDLDRLFTAELRPPSAEPEGARLEPDRQAATRA